MVMELGGGVSTLLLLLASETLSTATLPPPATINGRNFKLKGYLGVPFKPRILLDAASRD